MKGKWLVVISWGEKAREAKVLEFDNEEDAVTAYNGAKDRFGHIYKIYMSKVLLSAGD